MSIAIEQMILASKIWLSLLRVVLCFGLDPGEVSYDLVDCLDCC